MKEMLLEALVTTSNRTAHIILTSAPRFHLGTKTK